MSDMVRLMDFSEYILPMAQVWEPVRFLSPRLGYLVNFAEFGNRNSQLRQDLNGLCQLLSK